MRAKLVAVVVAAGIICAACAGQPAPKPSKTPAKPSEAPTLEVLYTRTSSEKAGEFVIKISNPSDRTRVGLETTWKAVDSDGIIVNSITSKRPPIPPHGSILYAGGGRNFTGIPEKFKFEISKKGGLVKRAPRASVRVGDAEFERADYNVYDDAQSYTVTAVVTALNDVDTEDLWFDAILRDVDKNIVGAGWTGGPDIPGFESGRPERLAKGEKMKIEINVAVGDDTPSAVEVGLSR